MLVILELSSCYCCCHRVCGIFPFPFDLILSLHIYIYTAKCVLNIHKEMIWRRMRTTPIKNHIQQKAISDNKAFQFMIFFPSLFLILLVFNVMLPAPSDHLTLIVEDVIMYVYWIILSTAIKDFICIFMETNKDSLTAWMSLDVLSFLSLMEVLSEFLYIFFGRVCCVFWGENYLNFCSQTYKMWR